MRGISASASLILCHWAEVRINPEYSTCIFKAAAVQCSEYSIFPLIMKFEKPSRSPHFVLAKLYSRKTLLVHAGSDLILYLPFTGPLGSGESLLLLPFRFELLVNGGGGDFGRARGFQL